MKNLPSHVRSAHTKRPIIENNHNDNGEKGKIELYIWLILQKLQKRVFFFSAGCCFPLFVREAQLLHFWIPIIRKRISLSHSIQTKRRNGAWTFHTQLCNTQYRWVALPYFSGIVENKKKEERKESEVSIIIIIIIIIQWYSSGCSSSSQASKYHYYISLWRVQCALEKSSSHTYVCKIAEFIDKRIESLSTKSKRSSKIKKQLR